MELISNIDGYQLVCLKQYQEALHRIKEVSHNMNIVRSTLLHNIKILEDRDKNTFAKSIRLLSRLEKLITETTGVIL